MIYTPNCAIPTELSPHLLFLQPREMILIKILGLVCPSLLPRSREPFPNGLWLITIYYISRLWLAPIQPTYIISIIKIGCITYAPTCHTVLPLWSVTNNNLLFISSIVTCYLAQSHTFPNASKKPSSAVTCQTVLPFSSVANNRLLFISSVVN